MSTNITLKRSSVQGKVPVVGDLALGEIALNTYDGKLFIKKNVGGTETIIDVTANTNLSLTSNSSTVSVNSDRGTDATILAANATTAGVLTADAQTIAGAKAFTGKTTTGDITTSYNQLTINGGHVGDGDNDYGITINSFEPAITLIDRSTSAGSVQLFGTNNGGLWIVGDTLNDGTIGHTTNTTDFLVAKFEPINTIFYTSGVESMRIANTGNVGIGTAAPTTPLHINGTNGELLRLSISSNASIQQTFGLGFATGSSSTHPGASVSAEEFDASDSRAALTFSTRGTNDDTAPTERMRISSAGNVGIGTSAPAAKLDVSGDGSVAIVTRTDGTRYAALGDTGATDDGGLFLYDASANLEVVIRGGGDTYFNGGNVGIGTTTPNAGLDVQNWTTSSSPTLFVARGTIPTTATGTSIVHDTIGVTYAAATAATTLIHYRARPADAFGAGATLTNQYGFYADSRLTQATNDMGFYSDIAAATGRWNFYANGTADNYFAGNVGIGLTPSTSDPLTGVAAGALQVNGNIELRYAGVNTDPGGARYFNIVNTDTTLVADQPLGGIQWVGLDTDNPNSNMASITSYCASNIGTTGDLRFKIAGTESMRIAANGNVGIGNTTPADKLSVSGSVSATSFNATSGFIENSQVLASNYTLVTGRNAMSAGPIEINNGVTITIQDGARWVVI
jgi:hypothetical protein